MRMHRGRLGSLMFEAVIAFGILGAVVVIIGQVSYWNLREQLHASARQAALELAANLLEKARARDWQTLTPEWAASQALPEQGDLLPQGRLDVTVTTEKETPLLKRVVVVIHWRPQASVPEQSLELVTLIAARSTRGPGGKS